MNYLKMQNEVMKQIYNEKLTNTRSTYYYAEDLVREKIWLGHNNVIVVIPYHLFIIDFEKMSKPPLKIDSFNEALNFSDKMEDTGELLQKNGMLLHKFKMENGSNAYIDEKLLSRYFNMKNQELNGTTNVSPMFITEEGALVGIILPVKVVE